MKSATNAHQISSEIIRLCHSGLDSHTLRLKVLKQLQTVITSDYIFFGTTDPTTMLHTSSVMDPTPNWAMLQFLENEFVQDDFNKFRFLVDSRRPVGILSEITQNKLHNSYRYRNILAPMTLGDEMRAVFVTGGVCGGHCACIGNVPLQTTLLSNRTFWRGSLPTSRKVCEKPYFCNPLLPPLV